MAYVTSARAWVERDAVRREAILCEARERLVRNAHFHGRANCIRIDEEDGTLVLTGRLPSYYLKQILQTVLRDLDGVSEIRNDVDVTYPACGRDG